MSTTSQLQLLIVAHKIFSIVEIVEQPKDLVISNSRIASASQNKTEMIQIQQSVDMPKIDDR